MGDQSQFNTTRDDCIWKRGNERDECPDDDINIFLYTKSSNNPEVVSDFGWNSLYNNEITVKFSIIHNTN